MRQFVIIKARLVNIVLCGIVWPRLPLCIKVAVYRRHRARITNRQSIV